MPATISDQLRALIRDRRLSAYELAAAAGVDRSRLTRFLAGAEGLSLASVDKLATALRLRLVEVGAPVRAARRKRLDPVLSSLLSEVSSLDSAPAEAQDTGPADVAADRAGKTGA